MTLLKVLKIQMLKEVIYEEEDSPLVEVVSVDGSPREIVITMLDGKILKIACDY